MTDRAPIEVEVVEACRECGGRGELWYTGTMSKHPETCRRCKGGGKGTERCTLAPGSLDEALHRLGLAAERWDNSKSMISPESRAALGEMSQHLAEVRRLREAGDG